MDETLKNSTIEYPDVETFCFESLTGHKNLQEELNIQDSFFRKQLDAKPTKKNLFYGDFSAFDRDTCNYLNQYLKTINLDDVLVLNLMNELSGSRLLERINCDYQTLPWIIQRDRDLSLISGEFTHEVQTLIKEFNEISCIARESLKLSRKEMIPVAIELFIYYCLSASIHIIESLKPEFVVLWNQFSCAHSILDCICKNSISPCVLGSLKYNLGHFSCRFSIRALWVEC